MAFSPPDEIVGEHAGVVVASGHDVKVKRLRQIWLVGGVRHFDGFLLSIQSSNYWNDFIFGQATPEDHATHNDWICVMRSAIPVGRDQRQISGYSTSRG